MTRAAAAVVLFASMVAARQFTSGVNAVEVYASVTDRDGRPVAGLQRGDFTILEDGQPQAIGTFTEGEFPLSIAIAIDRSFSMRGALPTALNAARTLIGELRQADQATVVAIGSTVDTVAPLSTDRARQLDAVSSLTPWGTTSLHDAIVAAIDAVQPAAGRRALVLFSDGADRYSITPAAAARDHARQSDVMVYPIALGPAQSPLFVELAALTGGRAFHPRDPADANAAARAIAEELRHQYLLGYTPSRPIERGAGEWRSIVVRASRPDVVVRARDGYLAR